MNLSSPLKNFFQPRTVVGLEVCDDFVSAVQVVNTLRGPELAFVGYREIQSPEQIEEVCRTLFEEEDLDHEMLVTSISGRRAYVRELSVPFQKPRKLDRVIKFQMEPYVPVNIDRLVVDYLQPGNNGVATAVAVEKTVISDHLELLRKIGLSPDLVTLDDLALFFLYRRSPTEGDDQPLALLHRSPEKLSLQVVRGGRQDFLRVVSGRVRPDEFLTETLGLYRIKRPDSKVSRVLLAGDFSGLGPVGSWGRHAGFAEGLEITPWSPFDALPHKLGTLEPETQARLSVSLGLALSAYEAPLRLPNLRREEFQTDSAVDLRRMMLALVSGLCVLGLVFGAHLYQRVAIQEARYEALKREIRSTFAETFPGVRTVVKGRELVQMQQKIEAEKAKFSWLEDLSRHGSVLETLRVLTRILGGVNGVVIDDFSVEGLEVRLDGRAPSFETVDKLKEKLAAEGGFASVKLSGAKMDRKVGAVRFNFGLEKEP